MRNMKNTKKNINNRKRKDAHVSYKARNNWNVIKQN